MARGWESKDVESQVERAETERRARAARRVAADDTRRESLLLTRVRVQRDLDAAKHPRHREQVAAALRHLDEQLAQLARPLDRAVGA